MDDRKFSEQIKEAAIHYADGEVNIYKSNLFLLLAIEIKDRINKKENDFDDGFIQGLMYAQSVIDKGCL